MPDFNLSFSVGQQSYCLKMDADATLLESIGAAGLPVRKACRNGVCGACRCRLLSGDVTYHHRQPYGLWEKDIKAGYILPCIAYPISDVFLQELSLEK